VLFCISVNATFAPNTIASLRSYTVRHGIGQDRFGNALGVGLRIGRKTGEAGIFFNGRGGKRAVLWIENW
jgi:hypothetical protein